MCRDCIPWKRQSGQKSYALATVFLPGAKATLPAARPKLGLGNITLVRAGVK
jgi:hypothetical protein